MNTILIIRLLDTVLLLVSRIPAVMYRIQAVRDEIAALQAEGRDPTDAEWAGVGDRIDARLANLKTKVPPEVPPETPPMAS